MPTSFKHKASHNASLRKMKFDKHMTSYKFNEILFGFFKVQKFSAKIFFFSSSHQDNALSSVDDSLLILSRSSFEKPLSEYIYIYICPTRNIHKRNRRYRTSYIGRRRGQNHTTSFKSDKQLRHRRNSHRTLFPK